MVHSPPIERTATLTSEVCMQKASSLIHAVNPSHDDIYQASVMVTMARELRIAKKHGSRAYTSVNYPLAPEPEPEQPPVPVVTDGTYTGGEYQDGAAVI